MNPLYTASIIYFVYLYQEAGFFRFSRAVVFTCWDSFQKGLSGEIPVLYLTITLATAHAVLCRDEDMSKDYSFGLQEVIVSKEIKDEK